MEIFLLLVVVDFKYFHQHWLIFIGMVTTCRCYGLFYIIVDGSASRLKVWFCFDSLKSRKKFKETLENPWEFRKIHETLSVLVRFRPSPALTKKCGNGKNVEVFFIMETAKFTEVSSCYWFSRFLLIFIL